MKKQKKKYNGALMILSALAILAGVFAVGWWGDNRAGNPSAEVDLYVYPGSTAAGILEQLKPQMRRPASLERVFRSKKVYDYLKPGHYHFGRSASSAFIARSLNNGWQTPVNLTLAGSLRLKGEIARKIDTYELSSLPYEDCCTIFTPRHPATHPKMEKILEGESKLDTEALIGRALEGVEMIRV